MTAREAILVAMTARPIAHRGLHDASRGVIENSVAAARAAIDAGYNIECDVQLTKDGGVVVFHDDELERLTHGTGAVRALDLAELTRLCLLGAHETIPSFDAFLSAIDDATTLVIEIKSAFDGDLTLAQRVAECLASYAGRVVIESFDPAVIGFLRADSATLGIGDIPLGIVGEARYETADWTGLSDAQRLEMTHFLHYSHTRPDFLSWRSEDLPHAIPTLLRDGLNIPVTTWTVRAPDEASRLRAWADQIVFEGFAP